MLYLPDNHKITLNLNAKDCYLILDALENHREYNDDASEEIDITLNRVMNIVDAEEAKFLDDVQETFIKNHHKSNYDE